MRVIFPTRYAYDTLGNLLTVTDHAGHVTRLTYDTLGRKLTMDDPDMGRCKFRCHRIPVP